MKTVKKILGIIVMSLAILVVGSLLGVFLISIGCILPIILLLSVLCEPVAEGLVAVYVFILAALVKLDEFNLFARYKKKEEEEEED